MWNKIKTLFKMGKEIKACSIYKTKNKFKIVTAYRLESWAYIESNPITILPIEASFEQIKNAIFLSINSSKKLSEKEEDFYRLETKEFLKSLRETSYKKFYNNSTSCSIYIENNIVEIIPNRLKDYYLVEVKEDIQKIEYNNNKIEITKIVLDILEKKYVE